MDTPFSSFDEAKVHGSTNYETYREVSFSGFSAVCVPFGSRAASPTGTCIAGGTVR